MPTSARDDCRPCEPLITQSQNDALFQKLEDRSARAMARPAGERRACGCRHLVRGRRRSRVIDQREVWAPNEHGQAGADIDHINREGRPRRGRPRWWHPLGDDPGPALRHEADHPAGEDAAKDHRAMSNHGTPFRFWPEFTSAGLEGLLGSITTPTPTSNSLRQVRAQKAVRLPGNPYAGILSTSNRPHYWVGRVMQGGACSSTGAIPPRARAATPCVRWRFPGVGPSITVTKGQASPSRSTAGGTIPALSLCTLGIHG